MLGWKLPVIWLAISGNAQDIMLTIHSNQDSIRDVWRGIRLTLSVVVRRAAFASGFAMSTQDCLKG